MSEHVTMLSYLIGWSHTLKDQCDPLSLYSFITGPNCKAILICMYYKYLKSDVKYGKYFPYIDYLS